MYSLIPRSLLTCFLSFSSHSTCRSTFSSGITNMVSDLVVINDRLIIASNDLACTPVQTQWFRLINQGTYNISWCCMTVNMVILSIFCLTFCVIFNSVYYLIELVTSFLTRNAYYLFTNSFIVIFIFTYLNRCLH